MPPTDLFVERELKFCREMLSRFEDQVKAGGWSLQIFADDAESAKGFYDAITYPYLCGIYTRLRNLKKKGSSGNRVGEFGPVIAV